MDKKLESLDKQTNLCNDRSMTRFDSDDAEIWLNFAEALLMRYIQNFNRGFEFQIEILNAFQTVEKLTKDKNIIFHAMKGKGLILRMMGNGKDAVEAFKKMLIYSSNSVEKALSRHFLGITLQMTNEIDRAISIFLEGLGESPDAFELYLPLIESITEKKCASKEQWTHFYVAILSNVMRVFFQNQISTVGSETVERYLITSFLLPNTKIQSSNLIKLSSSLFYALHKITHELGEYNLAWCHLCFAHHIQSTIQTPYDSERYITHLSLVKQFFCKDFIENKENINNLRMNSSSNFSNIPIFVVGMMRSGSTLLELLLDSHQQIIGLGEDSVFNSILPEFRKSFLAAATATTATKQDTIPSNTINLTSKGTNCKSIENILHDSYQQSIRSQAVIQQYAAKIENNMLDKVNFIRNLPHEKEKELFQNNLNDNFDKKPNISEKKKTNKFYMVDKMLFNYRNIGFIHMLFPDAIIINLVRDPMDTLLSCLRNKFDDIDLEWTLNPFHLAVEYIRYLDYMAHWKLVLSPRRIVDIQYEALVGEPEKVLKSIIEDVLQLDWEANMLANAQKISHIRPVLTNSMSQVRHGITTSSIGSWKKYAEFLQPLVDVMRPELLKRLISGKLPKASTVNWGISNSFIYDFGTNNEDRYNESKKLKNIDDIIREADTKYNFSNETFCCSNDHCSSTNKLNEEVVLLILSKKIIPLILISL